MKLLSFGALATLTYQVWAINMGDIPPIAIQNLARTPGCAMPCILDPHWTKTYAPECADLPLGIEYGARLCRNYMYQHMMDHCIKGKCNDDDRKTVSRELRGH
jgi:hypothetical protein